MDDGGIETFLAALPLTAATRDVLSAGVEFQLYRMEMVPAPPRSRPATAPAPAAAAIEGQVATEGDAAAAAAEGGEVGEGGEGVAGGTPKMVEQLTMVGSVVVRLGTLLNGAGQVEISAPVSFVPGPPMFGSALVGEVLLPVEEQPERPGTGAATVTFTLHAPLQPPAAELEVLAA